MHSLAEQLKISSEEQNQLLNTLIAWSEINTHTLNIVGLKQMLMTLEAAFAPLEGQMKQLRLPQRQTVDSSGKAIYHPVGDALKIFKRPEAPIQVVLGGHMDTVFDVANPFQKTKSLDDNRLCGPGVADMKGGILVMLTALKLFERLPFSKSLGWTVLLTPDEEVGSPSSEKLYREVAKNAQIGLIFEPSFSDGNFVSARKGSANFVVVAKGRPAHAGRDFHAGRSAIVALARYITMAHQLNGRYPGVTINIGKMQGGEASNSVPELASCHIDIRVNHHEDLDQMINHLEQLTQEAVQIYEPDLNFPKITLHPISKREPKPFDQKTQQLFEVVKQCGKELSLSIDWRESGGVCDGNVLASEGVPTIDTLGVIGGNLHTNYEYMEIPSLKERAQLTALILARYASSKET